MSRGLLARLLLSAITLVSFGWIEWGVITDQPNTGLPVAVERSPDQARYEIRARPDVPLPKPLADGDLIDLSSMAAADRAALFDGDNITPGTRFTLAVIHGGRSERVALTTIVAPETSLDQFGIWTGAVIDQAFLLVIALLTLWRGRDWAAWGLFAFSSSVIVQNCLTSLTAAPLTALWLRLLAGGAIPALVLGPALYAVAESVAGTGVSRLGRRLGRAAVACIAVLLLLLRSTRDLARTYEGLVLPHAARTAIYGLQITLATVVLLVLIIGYRRAARESRLRMRWVLASTAILVASVVGDNIVSRISDPYLTVLFSSVVPGISLLGYLYAILRTRVVDLTFVIDRAVVFSVITALVLGAFSLLEQTVHYFAVGEQLGWVLQSLVAVLLAAVLRPLHRLLEAGMESVFFHEQRAIISSLRRLTTQAVYFENEEALLSRALKDLRAPCAAVAIYERNGASYRCRQAQGPWPAEVSADDPLFVALRAEHEAQDIQGMGSAAGAEGRAFPMLVAERLTGAVICRPRDGEQLDRDVRAAIADLARQLGTALYLLRYQAQERLIAEIAAGQLDTAGARSRALALVASA